MQLVWKQHTTAMVGFDLSDDKLGTMVDGGDAHITLLFLGDVSLLDSQKVGIEYALQQFAFNHAPIEGKFNGFAVFPASPENDDKAPVVALFDSPQLPAFRQALLHCLPMIPEQNHGFTPHMTLRYTDNVNVELPTDNITYSKTFTSIALFWGDGKQSWPLSGSMVEKQDITDPGALIDTRIDMFDNDSDALAEQLFSGDITVGQWTEDMKQLIKGVQTGSAAIGKGGWENMTQSDWGRVGAEVKAQYRYLQGFADAVVAQKDTISLAYIEARANMYGEAARHTANIMQAGNLAGGTRRQPTGYDSLPWMPGDGSTRCLTNCKCHWEITVIDQTDDMQLVQAVWTLAEAEHCPDCVERDGYTAYLNVPLSWDVPETVGL